ncbi:MAG: hypothetical protein LBT50_09690 [Prevotellaceae bacterium]|jgi:hypothetical protein|nr:hypothetical protein [Prevotellaceae bacterium]
MKKIYKFIVLILAIAIVSCNEKEEYVDAFSVVGSNVSLPATSSVGYIKVSSTDGYSATSNQSWCTVSIDKDTVRVSVVANPGLESRAAVITIVSGSQKEEIPVYQYGVAFVFSSTDEIHVSYAAQTYDVTDIQSSVPVITSFQPAVSWVSATADENNVVRLTFEENPGDDRTTKLVTTVGNFSDTIAITQNASFVVDQTELFFECYDNGAASAQEVDVQYLIPPTILVADAWLTATLDENTLTVYPNSTTLIDRNTTITITSGAFVKTVTVEQSAPLPLNQQLVNGDWFFAYSGLGPFGQMYWDYTWDNYEMNEDLLYAYMGTWNGEYGFYFGSENYLFDYVFEGDIYYDYQLIGEDRVKLTLTGYDEYNGFYYYEYAYFNYLTYPIGSSSGRTFTLTTDDIIRPTWIKLSDNSQPANTIILYADPVFYPYYY